MLFRHSLLLARRVAAPAAAPRLSLTRPFSYTPSAFSTSKPKEAVTKPKASAKKSTKAKTAAKAKTTTEDDDEKVTKKAKKSRFTASQLRVPTRRSPNAYLIYMLEQTAGNPKFKSLVEYQEQTKDYAVKWRAIPEDQKQVYYDKAATALAKVRADFEAWLKNVDPAILREINKKRKARGLSRILAYRSDFKGPLPPYISFLEEFRANNPNVTGKEIGIQGGAAWRELPQSRRDHYLSAYRDAKKAQEARA